HFSATKEGKGRAPAENSTDAASLQDIEALGVAIGDGAWSVRDLSPLWLRRNGDIYDSSDYPDLAALLGALPAGEAWNTITPTTDVVRGIAFGNGIYVAVGDNGYVATSTDLNSWTKRPSGISHNLYAVAYGNG